MSILGQDRKYDDPLTPEQHQRAWQTAYMFSLDQHSDEEIAWEADLWRQLNALGIATLCDALLRERCDDDFSISGEVAPHELTSLWQRMPRGESG